MRPTACRLACMTADQAMPGTGTHRQARGGAGVPQGLHVPTLSRYRLKSIIHIFGQHKTSTSLCESTVAGMKRSKNVLEKTRFGNIPVTASYLFSNADVFSGSLDICFCMAEKLIATINYVSTNKIFPVNQSPDVHRILTDIHPLLLAS